MTSEKGAKKLHSGHHPDLGSASDWLKICTSGARVLMKLMKFKAVNNRKHCLMFLLALSVVAQVQLPLLA